MNFEQWREGTVVLIPRTRHFWTVEGETRIRQEIRKMSAVKREATPAKRPRFPEAFQRDGVCWVTNGQYSFKAATAVGVCEQSLRLWHAKFAPQRAPCGDEAASPYDFSPVTWHRNIF